MNRASGEIAFVVNPHAAVGAVGKEWPRIEKRSRERLGSFRTYITGGPEDATHLTRNALGEGCEIIVCVGGDGTFNEVINGFMEGECTVHPNAAVGDGTLAQGSGEGSGHH